MLNQHLNKSPFSSSYSVYQVSTLEFPIFSYPVMDGMSGSFKHRNIPVQM